MDAKKIIEYGAIAVILYLVVTWLFGAVGRAAVTLSGSFNAQPDYGSTVLAPGLIYYGSDWYPGTPVRWGPQPRRGGFDGRTWGTGGY